MKKYIVSLKGTAPLVFNTLQKELEDEKKKLKKDQLAEWEQKNWKRKAERDEQGNVILPIRWFKRAFVNACKHSKKVPHFATSKRETYTRYSESLFFTNSTFKCKDKDLKKIEAYMGGTGAGSTTKVLKCFPKIDSWENSFEVIDGMERMTLEEMNDLFVYAGMIEGVGDFRKENAGRFEVISIKEK